MSHMSNLVQLVEEGNVVEALDALQERLDSSEDPQIIRDELYPVAQTVLNPPFINPHLPKMYRVCRELYKHLEPDEAFELLRVEVPEYARREKFESPIKYRGGPSIHSGAPKRCHQKKRPRRGSQHAVLDGVQRGKS